MVIIAFVNQTRLVYGSTTKNTELTTRKVQSDNVLTKLIIKLLPMI